ncbi:hypothetical protein [Amycolatopsis taiwanensis]|uniref:hypothetical protein n=1 Tax=Amycolatopsis taiwanensis TaxID=342230 RepID=UPI000484DBB6|nr:hypothetical protein [Amycolatopsis taiwanensis]
MTVESQNEAVARALLSLWDIPVTEEEIAGFAAGLPAVRATVGRLYAVPTGDDEPAVTFDASP